jgi:HlyD family secretion protein
MMVAAEERSGLADQVVLPLRDAGKAMPQAERAWPLPRRGLWKLPAAAALVFAGAVVGLYFQPPGLQAFFAATGLEPGGGSDRPAAVAPAPVPLPPAAQVVALGRLMPEGDAITVAPPFGAGDARIAEMLVGEGERVAAGQIIAVLDSLPHLEAARDGATAALAVREAALVQTRAAIAASRREAEAARDRAAAALRLATSELERARELSGRGITAQAALDRAELAEIEAARELDRSNAALSRYAGIAEGTQPDILRAERDVAAARADLLRAEADLARGTVAAPAAGTILAIHARPGERPGEAGVATLGDTERMTADVEVYQTDIGRVAVGQPVRLSAAALGDEPLTGRVTRIGLEVGRQRLIADDPAANTDARVVTVDVALDLASSVRAARLTGLEVTAWIGSPAGAAP